MNTAAMKEEITMRRQRKYLNEAMLLPAVDAAMLGIRCWGSLA